MVNTKQMNACSFSAEYIVVWHCWLTVIFNWLQLHFCLFTWGNNAQKWQCWQPVPGYPGGAPPIHQQWGGGPTCRWNWSLSKLISHFKNVLKEIFIWYFDLLYLQALACQTVWTPPSSQLFLKTYVEKCCKISLASDHPPVPLLQPVCLPLLDQYWEYQGLQRSALSFWLHCHLPFRRRWVTAYVKGPCPFWVFINIFLKQSSKQFRLLQSALVIKHAIGCLRSLPSNEQSSSAGS